MTEPFSTTDVYYVNATNCTYNLNTSIGCNNNKDCTDKENCECKYKENVDKLNKLTASQGLTQTQNGDLNKEHSLLILNNISLGIGIAGMMLMMYSKKIK